MELSQAQRRVLVVLRRFANDEDPDVDESLLLLAARSKRKRLATVFRRSPLWGTVVVPGVKPRTYRSLPLATVGAGGADDAGEDVAP